MTTATYHLQDQEIPEGYQIFEDRLEVAGVAFRKAQATAFAQSSRCWLHLEREEGNPHDKNAIRVIGCSRWLFFERRRFIGYVPKEVAQRVVENGFWGKIRPRLLKTYVSENGYVEILFQLVGPKGEKYQFNPPKSKRGGHYTEYTERVKQLKSEEKYDDAIELLLKLVGQVEREAKKKGNEAGVTSWYYEQLAIIYRSLKRYDDEVEILERYEAHAAEAQPAANKFSERLTKARQLRDKHRD